MVYIMNFGNEKENFDEERDIKKEYFVKDNIKNKIYLIQERSNKTKEYINKL